MSEAAFDESMLLVCLEWQTFSARRASLKMEPET